MSVEEPLGFTEDGELITGYRFTEADLADISMSNEMYQASPEAQDRLRQALDGLPRSSITIIGYFDQP